MRIVFDGQQVERLDPKIAKKITKKIGSAVDSRSVEGVILPADQIIADAARGSRMGLGVVGGVVAVILIGAGAMALAYEPADMIFIGPLYLVILLGLGWLLPFVYRRSMAAMSAKTTQRLARMAPAGTIIHLDQAGLTQGERATPWSEITVEAVEVVTLYNPDGADDYQVEAVVLDARGESVILDQGVITNGATMVYEVLRILGVDLR